MNINDTLIEIKSKLSSISNVETLAIGMEQGINAKDCPFIRIVPEINSISEQDYCINIGGGYDDLVFEIIFGFNRKNREIEKLYEDYYTMEENIRNALLTQYSNGNCSFIHTVTDEDKLDNLKSALMRFTITGIEW